MPKNTDSIKFDNFIFLTQLYGWWYVADFRFFYSPTGSVEGAWIFIENHRRIIEIMKPNNQIIYDNETSAKCASK